jgi:hypothetical protein
MANVQYAVGASLLADHPDRGRCSGCRFGAALRILFVKCARIVYVVNEDGLFVDMALRTARQPNMGSVAKNDSQSSGIGLRVTCGTSSWHFPRRRRHWLGWDIRCPGYFGEDSQKRQKRQWLRRRAESEMAFRCH